METISIDQSHRVEIIDIDKNLSIADKDHCSSVFENYNNCIMHILGLLHFMKHRKSKFDEEYNGKEQSFSLDSVDQVIRELNEATEDLTQSLIVKLENYFKKRYCLSFDSLILATSRKDQQPFSSYHKIIENIASQVGNDFLKAGKEQIKNRILKCFHRDRLPSLKGNKITIADFIWIDEHYGDKTSLSSDHNSAIEKLLHALNLFLNDATELPQDIREKLLNWKSILDLSEHHAVFPDVSFKFFKNRRIDVLFSSATIARRFWNYYKLEIIDKIIHENN
jgi:hypothetical protein